MKTLFSLLIIFFLFQYSKETACTSKLNPSAAKDCIEIELEGDEEKCCLFSYSTSDKVDTQPINSCIGLTEEQYEDINNYFKGKVEETNKTVNILKANIDCGSNYLIISILSLILLFL